MDDMHVNTQLPTGEAVTFTRISTISPTLGAHFIIIATTDVAGFGCNKAVGGTPGEALQRLIEHVEALRLGGGPPKLSTGELIKLSFTDGVDRDFCWSARVDVADKIMSPGTFAFSGSTPGGVINRLENYIKERREEYELLHNPPTGHPPGPDFLGMTNGELLNYMSDDAGKWAEAFCAIASLVGHPGIDQGWMISWFANAIEHSADVRRTRSEPATRPVTDAPLKGKL